MKKTDNNVLTHHLQRSRSPCKTFFEVTHKHLFCQLNWIVESQEKKVALLVEGEMVINELMTLLEFFQTLL